MPVHFPLPAMSADTIRIGLVNNMPDASLKATERQFALLLEEASGGLNVSLTLYALPEIPRTAFATEHLNRFYAPIDSLWDAKLDGLIVTGAEPLASNLAEEPYWKSLANVIDWADENAHSSVWSCLGAHAAVLHLDKISRRRLADKHFGLFECEPVPDNPLTIGISPLIRMPHSRWNTLSPKELWDGGYSPLTRARDGSIDAFYKQKKSLFVLFQGHPEYEAHTLLLEYKRDVGRFLKGERETYPPMPVDYFDEASQQVLTAIQKRAELERREEVLFDFPLASLTEKLSNPWRGAACRIYRNWLHHLSLRSNFRLPRPAFDTTKDVGVAASSR